MIISLDSALTAAAAVVVDGGFSSLEMISEYNCHLQTARGLSFPSASSSSKHAAIIRTVSVSHD